jgi:hypothetical protein
MRNKNNKPKRKDTLKEMYDGWKFGESYPYDENGDLLKKQPKPNVFGFIVFLVSSFISESLCRVKGHDWIDTSTAGPDSGDISGECERCGKSFQHILY